MPNENVVDAARFPSTQWSLVGRAGRTSNEHRRDALGVLLHRYMPALRAHLVLAKRMSADHAEDLLQGFVADKIIEKNLLAQAEQARGRFRSFLLAALNHYVISQFRHESAAKRSPSSPLLDIAEQHNVSAASAEPSLAFTLVWAREVVQEARRRMEAHCDQMHRADLWFIFSQRVLRPASDNDSASGREDVAGTLQQLSPKERSNLLTTAKRVFERILRSVVGEYAADEREIDDEIDDLMQILAQHG
jgi:hypothetical protein